jgi:hypothetical protein
VTNISDFARSMRAGLRTPRTAFALVACVLGTVVTMPSATAGQEKDSAAPESASVFYTYPGTPVIGVSRHGNVVQFERPAAIEHIGVGTVIEGYVLCYDGNVAYDLGDIESGFLDGSRTCSGSSCTFVRRTIDGRMELRQVIRKLANNERTLNVDMTVTNVAAGTRVGVLLRRHVDFDVDTGGALGFAFFQNHFATSESDSAFAWNAPGDFAERENAMVLRRTLSPLGGVGVAKTVGNIADTSCSPADLSAGGPVYGDYASSIEFPLGAMTPSLSRRVVVQFQRN